MRVLISGATGFLGSCLVKSLVMEGHEVIVLKRSFSDISRIEDFLPNIYAYDLDRCELATPFQIHGTVDAVVHAATCYGRYGENAGTIFNANSAFPMRLLETAVNFNVPNFVNMDTVLYRFLNAYALSKKQFAEWGRLFAEQGRINFINVLLEHFYGPGDDVSKFTTQVVKSCINNVPELKLTKGEQIRDFVYIDDVLSACLIILKKEEADCPAFQEYGLGSGVAVSIREFVEKIHHLSRSTTFLNFGAVPYRNNEVMESRADIRRLNALGWAPQVSLDAGIEKIIAYEKLNQENPCLVD